MIIESKSQITELRSKIYANANITYDRIVQCIEDNYPFNLFADIKFNKFGLDPIEGTPLNFIEQLNQMFSDLVVLCAVEDLLTMYPNKKFEVNFGSKAGFDIQSSDKAVVAECFAATEAGSNNKLRNDAKKLMEKTSEKEKYIYFYSQRDSDEKLDKVYKQFESITFKRVTSFCD